MILTRTRDGYCRTHLSTFGRTCTRCESEALREQAATESADRTPVYVLDDTDDDTDGL